MKRTLVVLLFMALATLTAGAAYSYKIQLKDGKVISADEKPFVNNDIAYFNKAGVYYYLPAAMVDFEKTEKLNTALPPVPVAEKEVAPPKAPVKVQIIGDDQLDEIRKRSRLANEGELTAPPAGEQAPPEGAPPTGQAQPQGPSNNEINAKLSDLLNQRATAQQQVTDLQTQMSALRDKYNFSPQHSDQVAIQAQMDALQVQLDAAKGRLDSINNDALATQQQLNRQPIVVQQPQEPAQTIK